MATPADMRDVYTSVAALVVLHNVLIDIGDSPLDIHTFDKERDDDLELAIRYSRDGIEEGENGELIFHPPPDHEADEDVLRLAGYAKRDALLDLIVPPCLRFLSHCPRIELYGGGCGAGALGDRLTQELYRAVFVSFDKACQGKEMVVKQTSFMKAVVQEERSMVPS